MLIGGQHTPMGGAYQSVLAPIQPALPEEWRRDFDRHPTSGFIYSYRQSAGKTAPSLRPRESPWRPNARSGWPDADIESGECPGHGRPGESLIDQPGFE